MSYWSWGRRKYDVTAKELTIDVFSKADREECINATAQKLVSGVIRDAEKENIADRRGGSRCKYWERRTRVGSTKDLAKIFQTHC